MEEKYLGKMIAYERKKKKISLKKLSSGILTPTGLKRLEDGERFPSFFVLERIIERLGRSMNKLELLLHEKDYQIYYLRGKLEQEIEKKLWKRAEQSITYYESLPIAKEPLHYQYLCKMKAVISSMTKEGDKAIKLLEEALSSTLCWWESIRLQEGELCLDSVLGEYSIGKEEIILLLMWIQQIWDVKKEVRIDGKRFLSLLNRYYKEDEEERADLFSRVCWILGSFYLKQGKEEEAYYFTKEGESVLADNRILLYLPQYLDRLVIIGDKIGCPEAEEWRKQRDVLKEVFLSYGKNWEIGEIPLWKNLKIREIYLLSELLEQERKVRNKSQQEIAFALEMDPKTISRLECGIYRPKKETLQKLREYYEICMDVCSTRIITEDFSLLEMERQISILQHLNRFIECEKLYSEFKNQLDITWKENRQFILYHDAIYAHQLGRISDEEALERCRRAFRVTRPNLEPEEIDNVILSRKESQIVNYIGICYRNMGQREKTITLLEKAIKGYENSKVDRKHYFISLGLLYVNLVNNYEENNQFEEALKVCEKTIHYELGCNKCSNIGYLIGEKQYTIDRRNKSCSEEGKKYYHQAFQLMKLIKSKSEMSSLKNAYKTWYGEELA